MTAKQGHKYQYLNHEVLAMESGSHPVVHIIDKNQMWPLRKLGRVQAEDLKPLPMVYFNGEVPK